eukprot:7513687-Heterocapsa_arctica.AAC.1
MVHQLHDALQLCVARSGVLPDECHCHDAFDDVAFDLQAQPPDLWVFDAFVQDPCVCLVLRILEHDVPELIRSSAAC